MNLNVLVHQYIELLLLKEKEEKNGSTDKVHFLEIEIDKIYDEYINGVYSSSMDEIKKLNETIQKIMDKLEQDINILEEYHDSFTNYDRTQMINMNYSLKYLINKLTKYQNIRDGLIEIINSKSLKKI